MHSQQEMSRFLYKSNHYNLVTCYYFNAMAMASGYGYMAAPMQPRKVYLARKAIYNNFNTAGHILTCSCICAVVKSKCSV